MRNETQDRNKAGTSNTLTERERELLARIHRLEEQNSALQDKLDMIYAILAPEYDEVAEEDETGSEHQGAGLVNIEGMNPPGNRES